MKNINQIRQDFPLLQRKMNGKPLIYFDNACQTLRPLPVIKAMNGYYEEYPGCGGRSMHKIGEKVTQKCNEARQIMADFIGAKKKEEIIFTRNTTEGINLIAHSFPLQKGDVVVTSDKEHNSNLIPWQILKEKVGIIHRIASTTKEGLFDLEAFRKMMDKTVKLVSVVYTSNLDGVTTPVEEVIKIAHQNGAPVLLDAAQAIPHRRVNIAKLDVDFLAFSGHKMLGPSGMGVLYGKYDLLNRLEPFMVGGDTVEYSTYDTHKFLPLPERFEAGLQNYAGIIGLAEAVKYLNRIGFENVVKQEHELNAYITNEIVKNPRVQLIGPKDPLLRGGIISFYVNGADHHHIALMLDETANIMVRSGQHCVHSWFAAHKIKGSVRVSLYFYNTLEEAKIFTRTLNKILRIF